MHSPSDLATFLNSPFASWMDRHALETSGDGYRRDAPDELQGVLADHGHVHERGVLARFESRGLEVVDIKAAVDAALALDASADRYLTGLSLTREALRRGVDVVFQGVLALDDFAGYPDFLVRCDGASLLGRHHYEVRDAKLAHATAPRHLLQLCCYAEMLHAVQGRDARDVVVITGDGSGDGERTPLIDCFSWYRVVKAAYRNAHARFDPDAPPDPAASRSHARWSSVAGDLLDAADHPCRVATITRREIERLAAGGITTMRALAEAAELTVAGIAETRLRRLTAQARLQLAPRADGRPAWELSHPEAPSPRGLAALPPATPADLYFDLEGYPLAEGGLEYLWGCTYHVDEGKRAFRHWWAHDAEAERVAFEAFVAWVLERRRAEPGMRVYHYGHYEITTLRRLSARHASYETELAGLLDAGVFVDLYDIVRHALIVGEPRYSLKNVERVYRGSRDAEVDNATDSITRYARARSSLHGSCATSLADAARVLNDILDYNRDDCDSTGELVGWLRERARESMGSSGSAATDEDGRWAGTDATAADAAPATPGRGARSSERKAEAAARRAEVAEARTALRRRLLSAGAACADGGDASEALWYETLAGLLDHGAREAKPAWREHLVRLDTPDDELFDDAGCIACCRRTRREPYRIGKQQLRHEYRFDTGQELEALPGSVKYPARVVVRTDGPREEWIEATVDIAESDASAGLVVLKCGTPPPDVVSLVPIPPAFRGERQSAIDSLVSRIESGSDVPRALLDVLRRRPPRIVGHAGGPLLDPARPACEQLETVIGHVAALDDSALVIQGPPGCGKTWTAARVIARLLAEGRSVAVSSNSHAAIGNLVDASARVCRNSGVVARFARTRDDGALVAPGVEIVSNRAIAGWMDDGDGPVVVGTTVHGLSRADLEGRFEHLFVDEAGQVAVASLVATSRCARNLVLIGDQMQLGQPTQASHPGDAGLSTLDYLVGDRPTVSPERGILLDTSFRLHPSISDFIGHHLYAGRLMAAPGNRSRTLRVPEGGRSPIDVEAGIAWVPVEHEGRRRDSPEEVAAVLGLVKRLLGRRLVTHDGERSLALDDVLFVAPYNLQVSRLREALDERFGPGARVGTVDRFQGQEAPVVVVSLCASDASDSARGASFLLDLKRLNVALSRAETLAVLVAHPSLPLTHVTSVEDVRRVNFVAAASLFGEGAEAACASRRKPISESIAKGVFALGTHHEPSSHRGSDDVATVSLDALGSRFGDREGQRSEDDSEAHGGGQEDGHRHHVEVLQGAQTAHVSPRVGGQGGSDRLDHEGGVGRRGVRAVCGDIGRRIVVVRAGADRCRTRFEVEGGTQEARRAQGADHDDHCRDTGHGRLGIGRTDVGGHGVRWPYPPRRCGSASRSPGLDPVRAAGTKESFAFEGDDVPSFVTRKEQERDMPFTREQYLVHPAVGGFVDRLAALICAGPGSFVQTYRPARGGPLFEIERFVEAYHAYHFAGKDLEQTAEQLAALSDALREALREGNDTAALKASLRIFGWGGVLNGASTDWLLDAHDAGNLATMLTAATSAVTGDHENFAQQFHHQAPFRSDSATTKLFAMANPSSAIYDDRVAAGLGWLVIEHCEQTATGVVPSQLRFCVKTGDGKNPSRRPLTLPIKGQGQGSDHALSNLRFNWILGELSQRECVADAFGLEPGVEVVRAIEAALFMIGKRFDTIVMPLWPDEDGDGAMPDAA